MNDKQRIMIFQAHDYTETALFIANWHLVLLGFISIYIFCYILHRKSQ